MQRIFRGIKFGSKTSSSASELPLLDILFSQPQPYANLENLETQLGKISGHEEKITFFSSPMALEFEVDASEIVERMRQLKADSKHQPDLK